MNECVPMFLSFLRMGVDYIVCSHTNPEIQEYVPQAWDCMWQPVMTFLDIEFPLLYEPMDPYLSENDVGKICEQLKKIVNDAEWDNECQAFQNDAAALLVYFEFYVANKARIIRC